MLYESFPMKNVCWNLSSISNTCIAFVFGNVACNDGTFVGLLIFLSKLLSWFKYMYNRRENRKANYMFLGEMSEKLFMCLLFRIRYDLFSYRVYIFFSAGNNKNWQRHKELICEKGLKLVYSFCWLCLGSWRSCEMFLNNF